MIRKIISLPDEDTKLLDLPMHHLGLNEVESEKLIRQGGLFRNKKRMKDPAIFLSGGEVEMYFPHKPIVEYTLNPINIRFEDEHIMLVYKEPGVPACPSPFSDFNCMTWGVEKYLKDQGLPFPVHAVHRLDKPAQGLMFFAKHKEAEKKLHAMFFQKKIRKLYLVVTEAFNPDKTRYWIKDNLEWKGKEQKSSTFIRYIGTRDGFSYLTASPLTGRPHQIRKHFAGYLKPIVGDALYGNYSAEDEMLLCAYQYRFRHPFTGERMKVEFLPAVLKDKFCGLFSR